MFGIKPLRLLRDRRATTSIEYGLIAVGIAVAIAASLATFGDAAGSLFDSVAGTISDLM
ncbi:MAG: Flp family type IVb pilin [Alphaproteobacteria bacterium]